VKILSTICDRLPWALDLNLFVASSQNYVRKIWQKDNQYVFLPDIRVMQFLTGVFSQRAFSSIYLHKSILKQQLTNIKKIKSLLNLPATLQITSLLNKISQPIEKSTPIRGYVAYC
jgi:hypothetical protein